MNALTSRLRQFVKSEEGISSVEYALLLAFIGGGIIAGATALGTAVNGEIQGAADTLTANDPANEPVGETVQ